VSLELSEAAIVDMVQAVLEPLRKTYGASELRRVEKAVAIAFDQATADDQAPLQRAQKFHFPGLPATPWFDLSATPQMRDVVARCRAAAADLKAEFLAACAQGAPLPDYYAGFEQDGQEKFPNVQRTQWTTLFLRKDGQKVNPGTVLCPRSTALVDSLEEYLFPFPEAFFSVLSPGARLPKHHDNTNAKLNFHVGVIVPPGCGIEVGGETRSWVEGECLGFDDSFLHQAWNESRQQRVVLILDLWRPELTLPERVALKQLLELVGHLERHTAQKPV